MNQKVKEKPIDDMKWYERKRGYARQRIEKLTAEQIVWCIRHIASDKQEHVLWEDCARWLDYKMREIKKLVSYLERRKP